MTSQPPTRPRLATYLPWVLGLALLLAGAVVYRAAPSTEGFGWVAYAPLQHEAFPTPSFGPGLHLVTSQQVIGAALGVLGLVTLATWAAYVVGRRAGRGPATPTTP